MIIKPTAQEKIADILENVAPESRPISLSESLITVERNGEKVTFRLREFNDSAKKAHLKAMRSMLGKNSKYSQSTQEELDNFGRSFTVQDLSEEEFDEIKAVCDEIIDFFRNYEYDDATDPYMKKMAEKYPKQEAIRKEFQKFVGKSIYLPTGGKSTFTRIRREFSGNSVHYYLECKNEKGKVRTYCDFNIPALNEMLNDGRIK